MKEFRFAVKNTIPIFFTYLFIGIAFGILMSDAGYSILLTTASSLFIFAGSMQLVMVPMMTSGAPLPSLALMAFFINARHIFYGIGFIEKFRQMGWRYPYMILTLTDETYSVLCSVQYEEDIDEDQAAFLIAMLNHLYWIFGSFIGACAGQFLQFDMRGIEFSATAFFLVVVVNQWQQYRSKLPFLTATVCALGFYLLLGKEYFLIPTLITCLVALILLCKPIEKKEGIWDE
ncbi:MAG: AzlC family ABC transporter permease [Lachnospiraceae bacterium]|nr:AzlC family ABC transporter permease [Lachnospiraceae bacterium]